MTVKISLDKTINGVPVGSLSMYYWIRRDGIVMDKLNPIFRTESNPNNDAYEISDTRYEQLMEKYNPDILHDPEFDIMKHASHHQPDHAGKFRVKFVSHGAEFKSELTSEEMAAVDLFTGTAFHQVQARARGKRNTYEGADMVSDGQANKVMKIVDGAIAKSRTESTIEVVRIVDSESIPTFANFGMQATMKDKAYTLMNNYQPLMGNTPIVGQVKLQITAPKGTTALPLRDLVASGGNTWLFPRDTKIRLTGWSKIEGATLYGTIVE